VRRSNNRKGGARKKGLLFNRGASPLYFPFFDPDGCPCFPDSGAPINFVHAVMHDISLSGHAKLACFSPPWAPVAFSHKSMSLSHLLRHALTGSCAKTAPARTVRVAANVQHRSQLILISHSASGMALAIAQVAFVADGVEMRLAPSFSASRRPAVDLPAHHRECECWRRGVHRPRSLIAPAVPEIPRQSRLALGRRSWRCHIEGKSREPSGAPVANHSAVREITAAAQNLTAGYRRSARQVGRLFFNTIGATLSHPTPGSDWIGGLSPGPPLVHLWPPLALLWPTSGVPALKEEPEALYLDSCRCVFSAATLQSLLGVFSTSAAPRGGIGASSPCLVRRTWTRPRATQGHEGSRLEAHWIDTPPCPHAQAPSVDAGLGCCSVVACEKRARANAALSADPDVVADLLEVNPPALLLQPTVLTFGSRARGCGWRHGKA
jgi:hypothetical protein